MNERQGKNDKSGDKDKFYKYVSSLVDERLEMFFHEFSGLSGFEKERIEAALKLRLYEQPVHQSVFEKVAQNTLIKHWQDMGKVADLMNSIPAARFLGSDEATASSLYESAIRQNSDMYLGTISDTAALGIEGVLFNHRNVMRAALQELIAYSDECKNKSKCYETGEFQKPPVRKGNPPKVRTAVLEQCSETLFEYMESGGYKVENVASLLHDLFSQVDGLGKADFSKDLAKIKSFYKYSEFKPSDSPIDHM